MQICLLRSHKSEQSICRVAIGNLHHALMSKEQFLVCSYNCRSWNSAQVFVSSELDGFDIICTGWLIEIFRCCFQIGLCILQFLLWTRDQVPKGCMEVLQLFIRLILLQ